MSLIRHTETHYKPADADRLAAKMTADDEDGWTYKAVHDPKGTGWSYIAIYDDDGHFVGKL